MGESGPYYPVINAADPTGRDIEEKRRIKEKERKSKDKEIREEE